MRSHWLRPKYYSSAASREVSRFVGIDVIVRINNNNWRTCSVMGYHCVSLSLSFSHCYFLSLFTDSLLMFKPRNVSTFVDADWLMRLHAFGIIGRFICAHVFRLSLELVYKTSARKSHISHLSPARDTQTRIDRSVACLLLLHLYQPSLTSDTRFVLS